MELKDLIGLAPMLDTKAYAELTHQKPQAVTHQIREGILPTIQPTGKNGKVFINMIALAKLCAEAEDKKAEWNKAVWKL